MGEELTGAPLPSDKEIMQRHIQECAERIYEKNRIELRGFHPTKFAEEISDEIKTTLAGSLAALYGIRNQTIFDPRSLSVVAEMELATRKIMIDVKWASPDPREKVSFAL